MPGVDAIAPNEHLRIHLWLERITALHLDPMDGQSAQETDPAVVAAIAVIGGLIVVVAAINFVTLMTARASRRAVEVGVRKALGAGRRDLFVQFMGEALVYVAVALVVGVAIAEIVLPGLNTVLQRKMAFDYLGDPALLVTMIAVVALVGLLAGVYPAMVLSAFRPAAVLKGGPIGNSGGGGLRQALVVTPVLRADRRVAGGDHHRAPDRFRGQRGNPRETGRGGGLLSSLSPCTGSLCRTLVAECCARASRARPVLRQARSRAPTASTTSSPTGVRGTLTYCASRFRLLRTLWSSGPPAGRSLSPITLPMTKRPIIPADDAPRRS